jgi:hypothetical protein
MALSALSFALFDDIQCVITTDPALTKLAEEIQQGCTATSGGSSMAWSWSTVGSTFPPTPRWRMR